MEYHDLTFDEAVRVLTPKSSPALRPESLVCPRFRKSRFRFKIGRKVSKAREEWSGKRPPVLNA
jgi:hypothetical protein